MKCIKCQSDVPDGKYCNQCGALQERKAGRRMRPNGSGTAYKRGKTWTASVTIAWEQGNVEGKLKPVKRTKGGFKTKRDALEYCQVLKSHVAAPKRITIKELYDIYESTKYTKLSKSKQTAYDIAYGKLKDIYYTEIQDIDIKTLQDQISGMTYYPAKDIKSVLSHLYEIACAHDYVRNNLSQYMVLPELEEKEQTPFNETEIKSLWKAYDDGDTWIGYILLMIYSGMMPGELLRCRKETIDLEGQMIIGSGIKTKERKTKPIVLADFMIPVVSALMELSDGEKLIKINKDNFYKTYYKKLEDCACRKLPPYSCRHTTATALAIGKDISPSIIQKIMRHSKFSTTERYIHPDAKDSVAAINTLAPQ